MYTHWRKTGERSIVAHFVLLVERPVSVSMHLRAVFVSLSKPTEIEFIIQTPRTSFVFRFDGKGIGFRKQLLCFSTQEPDILIIVALTVVYKARIFAPYIFKIMTFGNRVSKYEHLIRI